jgi:hypothetical protein
MNTMHEDSAAADVVRTVARIDVAVRLAGATGLRQVVRLAAHAHIDPVHVLTPLSGVARISDGAASGGLKQLGGDLEHRWREPGPGAGGSGAGGLTPGG